MDKVPNRITAVRILSIPVLMYFLLSGMDLAALALFLFSSVTDFLDGYIARRGGHVSAFGKYADPIADKVLVSTVFITFVQLDELSAVIVVIVVAREFLVTGLRLVGSARDLVISASPLGKAKTVTQIVLIASILVGRHWNLGTLAGYLPVITYLMVAATLLSGTDYAYRNKRLIEDVF
ncbi:CDP-diacylglycerol--glycerol-3-phosphate 3-phosphatidyltransferase [Candidatus Bipolaricaulota bacterium]|nr:CDP-diacylglycerol--glycerol-3-phosphate 3-phosphatidyltransferase [Candidatus Bipolaricaulota bacterium]